MLIDTHAHLNFNAYKDDADEVIRRALNNGVWMINVGSQYKTSKRAVEIAEKYKEGIFASVGLHPIHLADGIFKTKIDPAEMPNGVRGASKEEIEFETKEEDFDYEKYKELALRRGSGQAKSKVVAIGEIGLDYWYKPKTKTKLSELKEKQREAFLKQLDEYYQQVKQNWAFTGEFGGGTATLGSCHYAIQQAVLNPEKVIQRRFHRVRHQPVISYEDSSAIINSHWRAKHYPHWFQGWPVCLKVELKSLAVGLLYCLFMYLLYSAFF